MSNGLERLREESQVISLHSRCVTEENGGVPAWGSNQISPQSEASPLELIYSVLTFLFSPFSSTLVSIFVCIPLVFPFTSFYFCPSIFILFQTVIFFHSCSLFNVLSSSVVSHFSVFPVFFSFIMYLLSWSCIIFTSLPYIFPHYDNDGRTGHLKQTFLNFS